MITAPIPTDNLYKFIALGGLIIVGSSYWFPEQLEESITPKIYEAKYQAQETVHILQDNLPEAIFYKIWNPSRIDRDRPYYGMMDQDMFYALNEVLIAILNIHDEESTPEKVKAAVHRVYTRSNRTPGGRSEGETLAIMLNIMKERAKYPKEVRQQLYKLEEKLATFWDLNRRREQYSQMAFWGKAIGGVCTIVGFFLWYYKVQRYQDTLLVAQNEEIKFKMSPQPANDQPILRDSVVEFQPPAESTISSPR